MSIKLEINAIITIAFRDFKKLLGDRMRLIASLIFPFLFIGVLGKSLDSNLSGGAGYDFLTFVFTGVVGQTLFQSTASGLISLIADRENDFSQELFVSPISRYSIIIGKILGESMVAFAQLLGIVIFGLVIGIDLTPTRLLLLLPVGIIACLLGGAFGVLILANLKDQRSANQIFPFVIFPQYILAGVFNPVQKLPFFLFVLSRISPMTYAVDLVRSVFYLGTPEASRVTLNNVWVDSAVVASMFLVFLVIGTILFVKNERNR